MAKETRQEKRLRDIDDLLDRLKVVQDQMPGQEEKKSKKNEKLDTFTAAKKEFLLKLKGVKRTIKSLQDAQQKVTTKTMDQIQKQQQVRTDLKELTRLYNEMEKEHTKEKRKKKSKLTEEELKQRDELLQLFQSQLMNLKQASTKGYIGSSAAGSDIESGNIGAGLGINTSNFLRDSGNGSSNYAAAEGVELTEIQKQALLEIEEKDKEFDETLDAIEKSVVRAGELAKQIGEQADLQNQMLNQTDKKIDIAQSHLTKVNVKMKEQLVETTGCGFERICINIMCLVVFLGILGVILNLVT